MIEIPNKNTKQITQPNVSDILGSIWSSMNLDLQSNRGRIRVSPRGMIVSNSTDLTNLGTPAAFQFYVTSNDPHIFCIAGSKMFKNDGRASDAFEEDTFSNTLNSTSDLALFNGLLYALSSNKISKNTAGTWSTAVTLAAASDFVHCVYAGKLYFSYLTSQVAYMNTSEAVVIASGSPNSVESTLQLADFGAGGSTVNTITAMKASSNRIWIATMDATNETTAAGRNARIFEWDGASTQANKVYNIDSVGVLALVIKDDRPYAVDSDGRLLAFNGGAFVPVARLPIPRSNYLVNPTDGTPSDRFIHPNGITVLDEKIVMLINNQVADDDNTIIENLPSGIWEYDEDIGLYHKYSCSQWQYGVSSVKADWAQNRLSHVGAVFNAKSYSTSSVVNGDLMWGAQYYTTHTATKYGIFINDTLQSQAKVGYFVTTKIESVNLTDIWQKIYCINKLLLDSTDRICLKYRTTEAEPIEGKITWTSSTIFTSTLDLSTIAAGDEVEVTSGGGSGQIEHISTITSSGSTYTVTLANSVFGATGTSKARFQKWISLGEQTSQTIEYKDFSIGKQSSWIQFKCVMYFTGNDELNSIRLINVKELPNV